MSSLPKSQQQQQQNQQSPDNIFQTRTSSSIATGIDGHSLITSSGTLHYLQVILYNLIFVLIIKKCAEVVLFYNKCHHVAECELVLIRTVLLTTALVIVINISMIIAITKRNYYCIIGYATLTMVTILFNTHDLTYIAFCTPYLIISIWFAIEIRRVEQCSAAFGYTV